MAPHESPRLLVGARDYRHASWRPGFYPRDLPPEWRFVFYSHRAPAILMPMRAPAFGGEDLVLWEQEAPPEFRIVLEVSGANLDRVLSVGPVPQPLIAGCVVRAPRLTRAHIGSLAALTQTLPVAVDLRVHTPASIGELSALGIGVCGRPAEGLVPIGPFVVSLMGAADRRLLGRAVQELLRVPAPRGSALFFHEPRTAMKWVEEAQLLAGMLA